MRFASTVRCALLVVACTSAWTQARAQEQPGAAATEDASPTRAEPGESPGAREAAGRRSSSGSDAARVEALGVRFTFFGQVIVNANYNSATMVAGSIPAFVQLRSPATTGQFNVSPGNTFLGVDALGPTVAGAQLGGRLDLDFRSNAPYLNENAFLPLLRDLYLELRWTRLRLLVGQTSDVISPRASASLNFYPLSFVPGDIGDYRPQLRVEWREPLAPWLELQAQGAIAQAVQTFNVSDTVLATQAGLPDFQGHLGLAFGAAREDGPRTFELGVAGHVGRRQALLTTAGGSNPFTAASWSFVADASLRPFEHTVLQGEFFTGQLVGDYSGAINQTIDPQKRVPIRSRGGWVQLSQQLGARWTVNVGFGTDDPFDQDLGAAERSGNSEVYGSVLVDLVAGLRLGVEQSWWRTAWVGRPAATALRSEVAIIWSF